MDKLQHVQNAATRLVTESRKYTSVVSADAWRPAWLVIPQRLQYKLAVTVHRCLRHRAPWYLAEYFVTVSEVSASICDLPNVINCQFREFAAALLAPVNFPSPYQQPGIHCLISCAILLLTPNNLVRSWRRICSPSIRNVSALEVLRNCALQIDIYLLTYLLTTIQLYHYIL